MPDATLTPSPAPPAPTATTSPYGLLAEFDTTAATIHAAAMVRDAGYQRWDVFTPFPVHGMDEAMGLRRSKVGWFTFFGGLAGFCGGMLMIWYMDAYDYPTIVGGKPLFSPIFAFPVAYELTILLGAFGALLSMLFLNRLPRLHHPLFNSDRFTRVTHDKFFIVIETSDPQFSEPATRRLLEDAGSKHIEEVRD